MENARAIGAANPLWGGGGDSSKKTVRRPGFLRPVFFSVHQIEKVTHIRFLDKRQFLHLLNRLLLEPLNLEIESLLIKFTL
jgi:hypothetical protein